MILKIIFISILLVYNMNIYADERITYEILIKDHLFIPDTLHVKEGEKVKLIVKNEDAIIEEFESIDLKREKIVPPKSKIVVLIGPLQKGEYKFFGDFHPKTAQGKIIVE